MNKKHIVFICLFMLSFCFSSYGQKEDNNWEKIKALKVAFITEKLELGSKDAQKFWPIYNTYEEKRNELRTQKFNEVFLKIKDLDQLSEKEASSLLKKYIDIEEKEEILDKEFLEKLSEVVSSKKAFLLLKAEEDFKRNLIREYRQKHGNR